MGNLIPGVILQGFCFHKLFLMVGKDQHTYLEVTENQKANGHSIRNTLVVVGNGPRHDDGVEELDGAPNPEENEDDRNECEFAVSLLHHSHQPRAYVLL